VKDRNEPILAFSTVQDIEAYMAGQPKGSKGFWLKLSKIGAPEATVSKAYAIEARFAVVGSTGSLPNMTIIASLYG
jgi:hypothetical protein